MQTGGGGGGVSGRKDLTTLPRVAPAGCLPGTCSKDRRAVHINILITCMESVLRLTWGEWPLEMLTLLKLQFN